MNPRSSRKLLAGAFLATLVAVRSRAAPPDFATHAVVDPVGGATALSTKTVTALLRTSRGELLIGTQSGLYEWDGAALRRSDLGETAGGAYVRQILERRDGRLLVGIEAGLYEQRGGMVRKVPLPGGAKSLRGSSQPLVEIGGRLALATDAGLFVETGSGERKIEGADDTTVLAEGPDGTLWGAGPGELRRFENGRIAWRIRIPEPAVALAFSRGEPFLRSQRSLYRIDLASGAAIPENPSLPPASDFGVLTADREGRIYSPTGLGLHVREPDGRWRSWNRKSGLVSDAVFVVTIDRDGSLLVGYGGAGVERWPNPWTISALTEAEGLPNDVVWAIGRDSSGHLLVGTNDGLAIETPGGFRTLTERDGLPGRVVRDLAVSGDGSIWTLSVPGGLARIDGRGVVTPVTLAEPRPVSLARSPDGRVFVGTRTLLYETVPGGAAVVPSRNREEGRAIVLAFAPDGTLWSGGRSGIARITETGVDELDGRNGLPAGIDLLAAVSRDEAWAGFLAAPGVARIRFVSGRPEIRVFGEADGVVNERPFLLGAEPTPRGPRIFAGSDAGVSIFEPEGPIRTLDRGDGFVWNDTSANAFFEDEGGTLFLGTSRGLAILPPAEGGAGPPRGSPPGVYFASLRGDRKPLAPGAELRAGELEARIGVASARPGEVRLRYRLLGLDTESRETKERELHWGALPPGTYRLEVAALDREGRAGPAITSGAFTVLPPFWATWPFRIFVAALLVAAGIGVHRLRIRSLVRGRKRLEALVTERTADVSARAADLSAANVRLEEAQRTIGRLQEHLAPGEELETRAASGAREVARLLACDTIDLWTLENDRLEPVGLTTLPRPDLDELRAGRDTEGRSVVPLHALSGEPLGALVLPIRLSTAPTSDQRLVDGLARQMASSFEVSRLRRRLSTSEDERRRSLALLSEDGIERAGECPRCFAAFPASTAKCPDDGTPLETGRLAPYRVAGRYRLLRKLGEGGMGAVFAAEDERLHREVALKLIRSDQMKDPLLRLRLEREAHAVARVRHPGVVLIHDFGETPDGAAWLVMELLVGSDYAALLRRFGRGTPVEVAEVATEAGAALAAAHAAGIVHRDLKPANLFRIARPGGFSTKVVDFGLARPIGGRTDATISGVVVGSPAYMSPEQIREGRLDGRSDLFSLASVLYELLTGSVPFPAPSISEILARILLEEPVAPSRSILGADDRLDRVFEDAFRKNPEERTADVPGWTARLVRILERLPEEPRRWSDLATTPGDSDSPTLHTR